MLGCVDAEAPKTTNLNLSEKNQEIVENSKNKRFNQEISKTLSFDYNQEEKSEDFNIVDFESKDFKQEISKTLDLDNYAEDPEQERRQQRIQELIPQIQEPIIL